MDQPHQSYSRGPQDKALLAMTIGQAFDRTVAQYPEGEALVVRHPHNNKAHIKVPVHELPVPELRPR